MYRVLTVVYLNQTVFLGNIVCRGGIHLLLCDVSCFSSSEYYRYGLLACDAV